MAVQEVIVYRNPLDKIMWDAYNDSVVGTVFAWICGLIAIGLILMVLWIIGKAIVESVARSFRRNRRPYIPARGRVLQVMDAADEKYRKLEI